MAVYWQLIRGSLRILSRGRRSYFLWVAFLTAWVAVGIAAYVYQLRNGLGVTAMNDHVTWGAYIANFTYLVGMAAAAVMLVIPAYVYKDHAMKEIVVLGEVMATVVMVMCLLFVTVDIGRPDRFWHMIPGLGRLNWPASMLAWDILVLSGYLALNAYIAFYHAICHFKGKVPDRRKYVPVVFLAMVWAISIHTVTAFLYAGLAARAHWNTAVLAPRFLASAFAAGPALVIVVMSQVRDRLGYSVPKAALDRLRQIMTVTLLINLFLYGSEVFTSLYTAAHHAAATRYMLFGLHGHGVLVPYIWGAIILETLAVIVMLVRPLRENRRLLELGCISVILAVWVEKGMGLVIPGFVPSPLGEIVEYTPSIVEFFVSAGIWALGALLFTLAAKVFVAIEVGELRMKEAA